MCFFFLLELEIFNYCWKESPLGKDPRIEVNKVELKLWWEVDPKICMRATSQERECKFIRLSQKFLSLLKVYCRSAGTSRSQGTVQKLWVFRMDNFCHQWKKTWRKFDKTFFSGDRLKILAVQWGHLEVFWLSVSQTFFFVPSVVKSKKNQKKISLSWGPSENLRQVYLAKTRIRRARNIVSLKGLAWTASNISSFRFFRLGLCC